MHRRVADGVCSLARNAGLQTALNIKNKASQHCIDVTVSASTSGTYKELPVGKVVDIRAQEKAYAARTRRRVQRKRMVLSSLLLAFTVVVSSTVVLGNCLVDTSKPYFQYI